MNNNFAHGLVDVTSGIFFRPKKGQKNLLKAVLKNMFRQLNVSYYDECCGEQFCGNTTCNIPPDLPKYTISNFTETRTIDGATATLQEAINFLLTMASDLGDVETTPKEEATK